MAAMMNRSSGNNAGAWQQVCAVPGCGRAIHTAGHSKCCSACPTGFHTRRCQHTYWAEARPGFSRCATEGCVHQAGPGHISCCSSCKHSGGQLHTVRCAQRQARGVQRAPTTFPTGAQRATGSTALRNSARPGSSMDGHNQPSDVGPAGGPDAAMATITSGNERQSRPSESSMITTSRERDGEHLDFDMLD